MDIEKNNIENHLQNLAVLKETANKLNEATAQNKQEFLNNLHSLYTNGLEYKITPDSFSNSIQQQINRYQTNDKQLVFSKLPLESQIMQLETQFIEASNFSSKTITKFLACTLTEQTKREWIPIRYLLSKGLTRRTQKEAYGIITTDSLLNFPNMGKTITLLKTPYYVSAYRYGIPYTEDKNKDITYYQNVNDEEIDYIWQMSSYNFISIADTPKFNAFFNLNSTKTKPFLHLPLSRFEQQILTNFNEQLPTYRNYNIPELSKNHPRAIANSVLRDIIDTRLQKQQNYNYALQEEAPSKIESIFQR